MIHLESSQGCEYCHNQCFLADESGRVYHPCCQWYFEHEKSVICVACQTSAGLNRQQIERSNWLKNRT